MFEFDICLCGNNENCPDRENCLRAMKRGAGIFTISDFYSAREEGKDCPYFFKREDFINK